MMIRLIFEKYGVLGNEACLCQWLKMIYFELNQYIIFV